MKLNGCSSGTAGWSLLGRRLISPWTSPTCTRASWTRCRPRNRCSAARKPNCSRSTPLRIGTLGVRSAFATPSPSRRAARSGRRSGSLCSVTVRVNRGGRRPSCPAGAFAEPLTSALPTVARPRPAGPTTGPAHQRVSAHLPRSVLCFVAIQQSPHTVPSPLSHGLGQRHRGCLPAQADGLSQSAHERRAAWTMPAVPFDRVASGPVEIPIQAGGDIREDRLALVVG